MTQRRLSWFPSAPARPMLRSSIPSERCCFAGFCCGSSGGDGSSSKSDGHASLRWMRSGEIVAARFVCRFELHHLYPREIRVEYVELPLAVFADLGLFIAVGLPAMRFHDSLRLLHVRNP